MLRVRACALKYSLYGKSEEHFFSRDAAHFDLGFFACTIIQCVASSEKCAVGHLKKVWIHIILRHAQIFILAFALHWYILKYLMTPAAESEGPDQTAHPRSLIWPFAVRSLPKAHFRLKKLVWCLAVNKSVSLTSPTGTESVWIISPTRE